MDKHRKAFTVRQREREMNIKNLSPKKKWGRANVIAGADNSIMNPTEASVDNFSKADIKGALYENGNYL